MARCSRCGATFNYDKREGICPKCCFYNRKNQPNSLDNEWTKNYSIDDSKYIPPAMEEDSHYDEDEKTDFFSRNWFSKLKFDRHGECKTEGSHVHDSSNASLKDKSMASMQKMKEKMTKPEEDGEISRKTKKNIAIFLLVVYVVVMFLLGVLVSLF